MVGPWNLTNALDAARVLRAQRPSRRPDPPGYSLAGVAPAGSRDFANPAGNLVVDLVDDDAVWRPIRTR
jgi:hypothetical protein